MTSPAVAPVPLPTPDDDFPWPTFWAVLGMPMNIGLPGTSVDSPLAVVQVHTAEYVLINEARGQRVDLFVRLARRMDRKTVVEYMEIAEASSHSRQALALLPGGHVARWSYGSPWQTYAQLEEDGDDMNDNGDVIGTSTCLLEWALCNLQDIASGVRPPVPGWDVLATRLVNETLGNDDPVMAREALALVVALRESSGAPMR
jgi:hypothetical protein